MEEQKHELTTTDIYADAFSKFQKSSVYQKLQKKFTPQPYYVKFKSLRIVALIASYAFNIFSALTAATAVYFFVLELSTNIYFAIGSTVTFILLLETSKRLTTGKLFQSYYQFKSTAFGLLTVISGLTLLSIAFSFHGSKKAIHLLIEPPQLVEVDDRVNYFKSELINIDEQIIAARNTKWNGSTTTRSQSTIDKLTEQRSVLQNHLLATNEAVKNENALILEKHQNQSSFKASYFALFTLVLELLFIFCVWYLEYFDFRSYVEFSDSNLIKEKDASLGNQLEIENPGIKDLKNEAQIEKKKDVNLLPLRNDKVDAKVKEESILVSTVPENAIDRYDHHKSSEAIDFTNEEETSDEDLKGFLNEITIDRPETPVIDKVDLQAELKKVRGKLYSAKYRIKNNVGILGTNERNVIEAEKRIEELNALLIG